MDTFLKSLIVLVIVGLIVGGVLFRLGAPCSWQNWMSVKDVPARCLNR